MKHFLLCTVLQLRPKISTDRAANNVMLNTWTGAYYLKEELFTVSSQLHYQGLEILWLVKVGKWLVEHNIS